MTKVVITRQDLGDTLDVVSNKVEVKVDNNTITVNGQGQLTANIPAPVTEINVQSFTLEETTLKLVETDNSEHNVDLGLVAKVNPAADNLLKKTGDGLYVKGEELQSLGGVKLGYLVQVAA